MFVLCVANGSVGKKTNTFLPFLHVPFLHVPLTSKQQAHFILGTLSEQIPSLVRSTSCARSQSTHTPLPLSHLRDAALDRAPRAPRPFSDGRVARAPAPTSPPPLCGLPVAACSATASTTRSSRPSKTLPVLASRSDFSKRQRCATPAPAAHPTRPRRLTRPRCPPPPRQRHRPVIHPVTRPSPRSLRRLQSARPRTLPPPPRPPRPRSRTSRGVAHSAGAHS